MDVTVLYQGTYRIDGNREGICGGTTQFEMCYVVQFIRTYTIKTLGQPLSLP